MLKYSVVLCPGYSAAQVKYKEAQRYREVSAAQAAARPAQAEADRIFRRIMSRPGGALLG